MLNKCAIALVLILALLGTSCTQSNSSVSRKSETRSNAKLNGITSVVAEVKRRYQNHPDTECRQFMTEWIESGQVLIIVDPRMPIDTAGTGLSDDGKAALMLNEGYFQVSYLPKGYFDAEKDSTLYHEFIHIKDHMEGKILIPDSKASHIVMSTEAERSWKAELHATTKEWEFLKKIHAELKFFADPNELKGKSERQALLDMLFKSLQKSYQAEKVQRFLPTWKKLYDEESAKIANANTRKGVGIFYLVVYS